MNRSLPNRIGPVRGALPAPCAAAALSSLTGRTVAACHRVLARNHGRCPLESAVTPGILTSLEDLGFRHALERHEPPTPFADWAARAAPGAYLVVVPDHVLAAEVVARPGGGRLRARGGQRRVLRAAAGPAGGRAARAAGAREHPLRAPRPGDACRRPGPVVRAVASRNVPEPGAAAPRRGPAGPSAQLHATPRGAARPVPWRPLPPRRDARKPLTRLGFRR